MRPNWKEKLEHWKSTPYQDFCESNFNKIETYLQKNYKISYNSICDIGCGIASTPIHFQKRYGSHLYLLEGQGKEFYIPLKIIEQEFIAQNIGQYTLLDISEPDWRKGLKDVKVDLILSQLAVGYHYSVEHWLEEIKNMCHENTKIFLNYNFNFKKDLLKGVEIIQEVHNNGKYALVEVRVI